MPAADRGFDPPPLAASPVLDWVLARAFGPADAALAETEGEKAAGLAHALGLAIRIASRTPFERLVAEIGDVAAGELRRSRQQALAREMLLDAALALVDETAAAARIPYAPLKGLALRLGGYVPDGVRLASDADLLVPEAKLDALQQELVAKGFVRAGDAYEHQAPALRHPDGGAIELHRVILGVRLNEGSGRRGQRALQSATFDDVAAAGLFGPVDPLVESHRGRAKGDLRLPRRELLAAHAIVHALAQHRLAPLAYPGLRMIADLVDLGFRGGSGAAMRLTIAPWIEKALAPEEAGAAIGLADELAAGTPPARLSDESARLLLAHFVAGSTDARYAESLKSRALEAPLSDRSTAGARIATVAQALKPVRGVAPGGAPESGWRYALRWVTRPFDLLGRWRRSKAAGRR